MLIKIIPSMQHIFFLCLVTVLIFSILSVQLFGGAFQNRCVLISSLGRNLTAAIDKENWYRLTDGTQIFCEVPGYENHTYSLPIDKDKADPCPDNYACMRRGNPPGNFFFDNLGDASLNIFACFTMDGWSDLMYKVRDAKGTYQYDIFFVASVWIGGFFVLNLVAAIQFQYYESVKKKKIAAKEHIKRMAFYGIKVHPRKKKLSYAHKQCQDYLQRKEDKCCCKSCRPIRKELRNFVLSRKFENTIQVVIVLNSLFLGSHFYREPDVWHTVLHISNIVFTVIFLIECILKLLALGIVRYLSTFSNLFDFLVVLGGLFQLFDNKKGGGAMSVFRSFRILRVFKLLKSNKQLNILVKQCLSAITESYNLGILIVLFMAINALIAKQIFHGPIPDDSDPPINMREDFQDFQTAFFSVFVIMTGTWVEPMRHTVRKFGHLSIAFYIEVILIGNFMLLNLFLAILLQNLEQDPEECECHHEEPEFVDVEYSDENEMSSKSDGEKDSISESPADPRKSTSFQSEEQCTERDYNSARKLKSGPSEGVLLAPPICPISIDNVSVAESPAFGKKKGSTESSLKPYCVSEEGNYSDSDMIEDEGVEAIPRTTYETKQRCKLKPVAQSEHNRKQDTAVTSQAGTERQWIKTYGFHEESLTGAPVTDGSQASATESGSGSRSRSQFTFAKHTRTIANMSQSYLSNCTECQKERQLKRDKRSYCDKCSQTYTGRSSEYSDSQRISQTETESYSQSDFRSSLPRTSQTASLTGTETLQSSFRSSIRQPNTRKGRYNFRSRSSCNSRDHATPGDHAPPEWQSWGLETVPESLSDSDSQNIENPRNAVIPSHDLCNDGESFTSSKYSCYVNSKKPVFNLQDGEKKLQFRTMGILTNIMGKLNEQKNNIISPYDIQIGEEEQYLIAVRNSTILEWVGQKRSETQMEKWANKKRQINEMVPVLTPRLVEEKTKYYHHINASQFKLDKGDSLGIFSSSGSCRKFLVKLVKNAYFEHFCMQLIALYSLLLVFDFDTSNQDIYLRKTIELAETLIASFFLIEILFRIIAMGLCCNKHSYLREVLNVIDFVLGLSIIADFLLKFVQLQFQFQNVHLTVLTDSVAVAKIFRAIRPLRLAQAAALRNTVESLLAAIPSLGYAMGLDLLFVYVFGILGVQLLGGRIGSCESDTIQLMQTRELCEKGNSTWIFPARNFNNVFNSMLTFFEIQTLDNWDDIAFSAIDAGNEMDDAGLKNNKKWLRGIFVLYIFLTTFFILNIIITILIERYQYFSTRRYNLDHFHIKQRVWVTLQGFLIDAQINPRPSRPRNFCRRIFYDIAISKPFDILITVFVSINTIGLCLDYYDAPKDLVKIIEIANSVFVVLFCLEAMIKIVGLGIVSYFKFTQNRFDFFLVCVSILGLVKDVLPLNITLLRVVRGLRILRVFKSLHELSEVLNTIFQATKNFAYVLFVSFLVMLIFTLCGMRFFGNIKLDSHQDGYDLEGFNHNANFGNTWLALFTLIKAETGEDWSSFMHDNMKLNGNLSAFYWITFVVIKIYILLNVVVAVIFEKLEQRAYFKGISGDMKVLIDSIENFIEVWEDFDRQATHFIPTKQLTNFVCKLKAPLGYADLEQIDEYNKNYLARRLIQSLNILDRDGKAYFPEVLWSIFYSVCGANSQEVQNNILMKENLSRILYKYPTLRAESRHYDYNSLCGNEVLNWLTDGISVYGYLVLSSMQIRYREMLAQRRKADPNHKPKQIKKHPKKKRIKQEEKEPDNNYLFSYERKQR